MTEANTPKNREANTPKNGGLYAETFKPEFFGNPIRLIRGNDHGKPCVANTRKNPCNKIDCKGEYDFNTYCGAQVCNTCGDHKGLARCFCGWGIRGDDVFPVIGDPATHLDEVWG